MMPFFTKPAVAAGYMLETSFDGSGEAIFSRDRRYRYVLTRQWDNGLFDPREAKIAFFSGLNPSKAGASDPDQTITKEIGFARRLGARGLIKVNLFGLVSTDPKGLSAASDPIGPDFAEVLALVERIAHRPGLLTRTILAWGSHPMATRERITAVLPFLPGPYECFDTCQDGQPRHTSRLPYATPPQRWPGI